jgi:hypothetical protein
MLIQQAEMKKAQIVALEEDLKYLNNTIIKRKEPLRVPFEIEQLKGEIRELTNEKARLELETIKSKPLAFMH